MLPRRSLQRTLRAARPLAAAVSLAMLGACSTPSWFHFGSQDQNDGTYDYHHAKPDLEPLEVPPDLSPVAADARYSVPAAARSAASRGQTAAPGGTAATAATAVAGAGSASVPPAKMHARIVQDGRDQWLDVDAPPAAVYAAIKDLWISMGYKVAVDQPAVGLIETDWAESRPMLHEDILRDSLHKVFGAYDANGTRQKYRALVQSVGKHTEVTVSEHAMEEVFTSQFRDQTAWQYKHPDPQLAAAMLQRIALKFAVAQAPVAVAAAPAAAAAPAPAPAVPTVHVESDVHTVIVDGITTLQVQESIDDVWQRVAAAIDRVDFTVTGRDPAHWLYHIRYLDPSYEAAQRAKRNWWNRVFNSDAQIAAQRFRIALHSDGTITTIEVQDPDGKPDGSLAAQHVLGRLRDAM